MSSGGRGEGNSGGGGGGPPGFENSYQTGYEWRCFMPVGSCPSVWSTPAVEMERLVKPGAVEVRTDVYIDVDDPALGLKERKGTVLELKVRHAEGSVVAGGGRDSRGSHGAGGPASGLGGAALTAGSGGDSDGLDSPHRRLNLSGVVPSKGSPVSKSPLVGNQAEWRPEAYVELWSKVLREKVFRRRKGDGWPVYDPDAGAIDVSRVRRLLDNAAGAHPACEECSVMLAGNSVGGGVPLFVASKRRRQGKYRRGNVIVEECEIEITFRRSGSDIGRHSWHARSLCAEGPDKAAVVEAVNTLFKPIIPNSAVIAGYPEYLARFIR